MGRLEKERANAKSVQNAENKRVTNKHKTSANEEKIGQEYSAARYVLEDCRAGIIGYVTTHLSIFKVNNGTLNAVGVFKRRFLRCQTAIIDKL